MEREDVVHVLRRFRDALTAGGLMLDLQVIRPNPVVEVAGVDVCEIDGSPLFATADPAAAEIDAMIASGLLVEEARDDHDVRKHFASGAELLDDFEDSRRDVPPEWIPRLLELETRCVVRERCRTRRLRQRG
ncbi:MAG TPA: hypothetical protein VH650_04760 [Gaiellaceae bacterium]|jgi:hypothetical protein